MAQQPQQVLRPEAMDAVGVVRGDREAFPEFGPVEGSGKARVADVLAAVFTVDREQDKVGPLADDLGRQQVSGAGQCRDR